MERVMIADLMQKKKKTFQTSNKIIFQCMDTHSGLFYFTLSHTDWVNLKFGFVLRAKTEVYFIIFISAYNFRFPFSDSFLQRLKECIPDWLRLPSEWLWKARSQTIIFCVTIVGYHNRWLTSILRCGANINKIICEHVLKLPETEVEFCLFISSRNSLFPARECKLNWLCLEIPRNQSI